MGFFIKNKIDNTDFQNKDILIIGAGRFGKSVAKTIHELGGYALLVDINEDKLKEVQNEVGQTIIADATDENILKSIEAANFDTAVVAIGGNLNASILTTLSLKEVGVKNVICKAVTEAQAKTLYKLGADKVIFPERDTGVRVAFNLFSRNVLESLDLGPNYSVLELTTPQNWVGKSISELNIRSFYNLNILAIKLGDGLEINPDSQKVLSQDDILLVLGKKDELKNLLNT